MYVTHFKVSSFKDSAYTERFMGLPSYNDNWKGYRESDITEMAERFVGKNLFLIHATADKNVHFQQSMVLAKRLVAANVTFRQQVSEVDSHP